MSRVLPGLGAYAPKPGWPGGLVVRFPDPASKHVLYGEVVAIRDACEASGDSRVLQTAGNTVALLALVRDEGPESARSRFGRNAFFRYKRVLVDCGLWPS